MKKRDIDLKLIHDDIICRVALNQDKVTEYGILMESGVVFPPIVVYERGDGTYVICDGRTRYHAADLAGKVTISCFVHPKAPDKEILINAFNANTGGPAQVGFSDARHTIMKLIELNCSQRYIEEKLGYPKSVVRRLYLDAVRNLANKKCATALSYMHQHPETITLSETAKIHGVKVETLVTYSKRHDPTRGKIEIKRLLGTIKNKGRSFTQFMAQNLKQIIQRYQDGELTKDDINNILTGFDSEIGKHRKNLVNWQNRFIKIG